MYRTLRKLSKAFISYSLESINESISLENWKEGSMGSSEVGIPFPYLAPAMSFQVETLFQKMGLGLIDWTEPFLDLQHDKYSSGYCHYRNLDTLWIRLESEPNDLTVEGRTRLLPYILSASSGLQIWCGSKSNLKTWTKARLFRRTSGSGFFIFRSASCSCLFRSSYWRTIFFISCCWACCACRDFKCCDTSLSSVGIPISRAFGLFPFLSKIYSP